MTNESKTMFIPLYGKAMMSKEGLLKDPAAEKLLKRKRNALITLIGHESLQSIWIRNEMKKDQGHCLRSALDL